MRVRVRVRNFYSYKRGIQTNPRRFCRPLSASPRLLISSYARTRPRQYGLPGPVVSSPRRLLLVRAMRPASSTRAGAIRAPRQPDFRVKPFAPHHMRGLVPCPCGTLGLGSLHSGGGAKRHTNIYSNRDITTTSPLHAKEPSEVQETTPLSSRARIRYYACSKTEARVLRGHPRMSST